MSSSTSRGAGRGLEGALDDLDLYLSDQLAPLLVVDSVRSLLGKLEPSEMSNQIVTWASRQLQAHVGQLSAEDLLVHALRKLLLLGELGLFPVGKVEELVHALKPLLLQAVPDSMVEGLAARFSFLGRGKESTYTLKVLHRPDGREEELPDPPTDVAADATGDLAKTLKLVGDRGRSTRQKLADVHRGAREERELGQALAGAAPQKAVPKKGLEDLCAALPDWVAPIRDPKDGRRYRSREMTELTLALGSRATGREVVEAVFQVAEIAIGHFHEGAPGRTANILEAAANAASIGDLSGSERTRIEVHRRSLHDKLDERLVQKYARNPRHRESLRRLVSNLPGLAPDELIVRLDEERDRSRRRFFLDLLELHGAAARPAVRATLERTLEEGDRENQWFIQRNCLYLLRRLPPDSPEEAAADVALAEPLSDLELPAPMVREALTVISQAGTREAEAILVRRLKEAEARLEALRDPQQIEELERLLDHLALVLARHGGAIAVRCLANHALQARGRDTNRPLARIAHLRTQDLTTHDSLPRILARAEELLPRRMLGLTITSDRAPEPLIESLASTPTRQVREFLGQVRRNLAGTAVGELAHEVFESLRPAPDVLSPAEISRLGDGTEAEGGLSPVGFEGDLGIFGLPNLLQSLVQVSLRGSLILESDSGESVGRISIHRDRLIACEAGDLEGEEALYQLLERPAAARFRFHPETLDVPESSPFLSSLILEGLRRHDELRWIETKVPGDARYRTSYRRPTPPDTEENGLFVHEVWSRLVAGETADEIRAALRVDTYRVRRLVAAWLDEGSLRPCSSDRG